MTTTTLFRAFLPAAAALALTAGCSMAPDLHRDSLRPYVPEVVQGNFVSREQRQYLRPGMSRAQVRDVLGTPLVASLFHADRWDYVFTLRRQGLEAQRYRLTLTFRNDLLSSIEGDELPSEAEFVQRLTRPRSTTVVPPLEADETQLERYPRRSGPANPVPAATLPPSYPPLESAPR